MSKFQTPEQYFKDHAWHYSIDDGIVIERACNGYIIKIGDQKSVYKDTRTFIANNVKDCKKILNLYAERMEKEFFSKD